MRKPIAAALALVAALLWLQGPAGAAVKPNALIGDGMVLQQGIKAPLWGSADDGEEVTVQFQGQQATTTAKDGKWLVRLDDLKVGGPFEMTIKGSKSKALKIKDVLVGEVWVCSGQSNMEMSVQASNGAKEAITESANPTIHLFTVPHLAVGAPQQNVVGSWKECGPDTVKNFSAVAYFFGRDLQKSLNVPVGLIHTSVGGTPAEAWTSRAGLEAHPELKGYVEQQNNAAKEYAVQVDKYLTQLDKYRELVAQSRTSGQEVPPPPKPPVYPTTNAHFPSSLYNGMVAPLVPYGMKGAIWYQGESNAGKAYEYRTLFPAMIKNWRDVWGEGDFPFLFVQLAPFGAEDKRGNVTWAELREAQALTAKDLPNTAMAVITDVGDEKDIHPKQKDVVGQRLALAAEALAYGKKVEYLGPTYESMKVEGDKALLTFKNVGGGLVSKGGPLQGFTIAGEDHKFVKAEATIHDSKVEVSSKEVEKPVAVRYGWSNYPVTNLFSKEGLPASPFRTDDFPLVTGPRQTKPSGGK